VPTSKIKTAFGDRLRGIRQGAHISQERLAEIAGLHRTYVSSVERGERNVSLETIERLAIALGCTMSSLMPDFERPKLKQ
jgi:transcriptional regulator with XRE-family HTH domain